MTEIRNNKALLSSNSELGFGVDVVAVKLTLSIAKSYAFVLPEVTKTVVNPLPGSEKVAAPKLPADGNDFVIELPKLSETM